MSSFEFGATLIFRLTDKAIASICSAQNKPQLASALSDGLDALGFQRYILSCNKADVSELMTAPTLTNWTEGELDAYNRGGWGTRASLLELLDQTGLRKAWQPNDWGHSAKARKYAEYLCSIGIRSGVTASILGRPETVSAITAMSFSEVILDPDSPHAVAAIAQAACTQAAMLGVPDVRPSTMLPGLNKLSAKQIEILEWASQGKSNRDIATIVGSSKRTIDYHMSEILRKLGVASRAQAVMIFSGQE